jgi:hypothetical protein
LVNSLSHSLVTPSLEQQHLWVVKVKSVKVIGHINAAAAGTKMGNGRSVVSGGACNTAPRLQRRQAWTDRSAATDVSLRGALLLHGVKFKAKKDTKKAQAITILLGFCRLACSNGIHHLFWGATKQWGSQSGDTTTDVGAVSGTGRGDASPPIRLQRGAPGQSSRLHLSRLGRHLRDANRAGLRVVSAKKQVRYVSIIEAATLKQRPLLP